MASCQRSVENNFSVSSMSKKTFFVPGVCPCGSGQTFEACCAPYLSQKIWASTAEKLMRSRFSAYVLKNLDYLLATWASESSPGRLVLELDDGLKWIDLRVVDTYKGEEGDFHGSVTFVARFRRNGKAGKLCERSRFVKREGRWFYLEGDLI